MIDRHAQFSSIQIPTEWGSPRFQMGQRVQLDPDNPGVVTGIEYIAPSSYWEHEGVDAGWHYAITLDTTASRYRLEPVSYYYESVIQPHPLHPPVSYPLAVAV